MPLINIRNSGDIAIWLVALLALLAFLDSIFNYFWTGNGIHGTEGALLVVASTFLMGVAAVLIGNRWVGGWLRTLFEILLVLDFAGTAAAACRCTISCSWQVWNSDPKSVLSAAKLWRPDGCTRISFLPTTPNPMFYGPYKPGGTRPFLLQCNGYRPARLAT